MKVIDILNKIANKDEVPKKIAIKNRVLIYNEDEILNLQDCYYMNDDENATWEIWDYRLNDEVEVIDDEVKEDNDSITWWSNRFKVVERDNIRLNNIIKDIKGQLNYLETYSSRNDVYEDMSRRLNRIENIVNKALGDKENE